MGGWLTSAAHLSLLTERLAGHSFYIQLNPTRERRFIRPDADTVSHFTSILFDLDPLPELVCSIEDGRRSVIEAVSGVLGLRVDPAIIDSGRGMQMWLRTDPVPLHSDAPLCMESSEQGEVAMKSATLALRDRIAHAIEWLFTQVAPAVEGGWKLDTRCRDLGRLARVPGSVNQKTGRRAELLHLGTPTYGLAQRLVELAPPPTVRQIEPATGLLPWHLLTNSARDFITQGAGTGERHAGLYKAAASLRDAGVDPARAGQILMRGALRCWREVEGTWEPHPLSQREVDSAVKSAWRKRW